MTTTHESRRRSGRAAKLRNIGPVSMVWLREIGIDTIEDLHSIGAVEAFRRVRSRRPEATANLLYALQGALLEVRWSDLPQGMRETLRREAGL